MDGLSPVTYTTLDALWKGGYKPLAAVSSLPESWTLPDLVDVDAAPDEAEPGQPDYNVDPTETALAPNTPQEDEEEYRRIEDEHPGNQAEEEESDDAAHGKRVVGHGREEHDKKNKRHGLCDSERSRHAAQRHGLHLVCDGDLVPLGRSKKARLSTI